MTVQQAPQQTVVRLRRHILDLDDFDREEIEQVMQVADEMREVLGRDIRKVPTLRGKSVVTLFYEPSTRTRVSFEQAAKILSADVINITASTSSVVKGETLLDTARTIKAMGVNVLVIRHPSSGAPYLLARHLDLSIINAGDGAHAHPTQALLDLYTIRNRLGSVAGKRVVLVGDIAYSRVARSNIWGLTTMGAQVVVCAPPTLLPPGLSARPFDRLRASSQPSEGPVPIGSGRSSYGLPPVQVEPRIERALEGADVVMALRLQTERQHAGLLPSVREYAQFYQVTPERLALARPGALVLHPGPMNEGVEISPDVAHGAQSVINEQVTNGVAIRMAILYLLLVGQPRSRSAA